MENRTERARIAVAPVWARESTFDPDVVAVLHTRDGEGTFDAQTDVLSRPFAPQHLRLQVSDRLDFHGTDGLGCTRSPVVDVILVQDEPEYPNGIEVITWPIDEARKLHKALSDLLDTYDTAGGE